MFKHRATPEVIAKETSSEADVVIVPKTTTPVLEKTSPDTVKELLEKNLKWSQIIYEQNRKLNNKLLWMAVSSWLRMLLIVVPLILGILYLPSLFQKLQGQYGSLLNSAATGKTSPDSIESLLKILPLNDIQRQQLKTILK